MSAEMTKGGGGGQAGKHTGKQSHHLNFIALQNEADCSSEKNNFKLGYLSFGIHLFAKVSHSFRSHLQPYPARSFVTIASSRAHMDFPKCFCFSLAFCGSLKFVRSGLEMHYESTHVFKKHYTAF